jgi:hypothetical protein
MTFFGMAVLTAIGTLLLAVFAVFTAWYARKAFREQSREVAAIEQQVKDEQEVTRQQAELLKVQSGQLELQRQQLEDQRAASARQAEVLELQAAELRESLEERKRDADDKRRGQAAGVVAWVDKSPDSAGMFVAWGATIRNASDLPIFDVRVFFHLIHRQDGGGWAPVSIGGPPPDETIPVLPPTTERFVLIPEKVAGMSGDIPISDATCVASLEFTDTAGNRWERDPHGALNPRT